MPVMLLIGAGSPAGMITVIARACGGVRGREDWGCRAAWLAALISLNGWHAARLPCSGIAGVRVDALSGHEYQGGRDAFCDE